MQKQTSRSVSAIAVLTLVLSLMLALQGIGYAEQQQSSETGSKEAADYEKQQIKKGAAKSSQSSMQYRSLIGEEVRTKQGQGVGEIDNLVVGEDGQVKAVVALGGFLGMGEQRVLVSMDQLQFNREAEYVTYGGSLSDLEDSTRYQAVQEEYDPYRVSQRRQSEYDRRDRGEYDRFDPRYPGTYRTSPYYQEDEQYQRRGYYEERPERRYPREERRYGGDREYERFDPRYPETYRTSPYYQEDERYQRRGYYDERERRYPREDRRYGGDREYDRFDPRYPGTYRTSPYQEDEQYDRRYDEERRERR